MRPGGRYRRDVMGETTTSTIAIHYLLSETGRRAAFAAGLPAQAKQTVHLTSDDPAWSAGLTLASIAPDGTASLDLVRDLPQVERTRYPGAHVRGKILADLPEGSEVVASGAPEWDVPQTAGDLVAWEQTRLAGVARVRILEDGYIRDAAARKLAEHIASAREWLAKPGIVPFHHLPEVAAVAAAVEAGEDPGESGFNRSGLLRRAEDAWGVARREAARAEYLASLPEGAEREAARATIGESGDAYDWQERAAKAAAAVRERAEMAVWAAEHGSERLRRCLAEGIKCAAAYRGERLAAERPDWEWAGPLPGDWDEPHNPPLEALDLLVKGRKVDPACQLRAWRYVEGADDDGEPGETHQGFAVVGQFLGREIAFGYDGPRAA